MHALKKETKHLQQNLASKDQEVQILQKRTQADNVELLTLRKACQLQKDVLYNMEVKLQRALEDASKLKYESEAIVEETKKECSRRVTETENELEKDKQLLKDRLQEVVSN